MPQIKNLKIAGQPMFTLMAQAQELEAQGKRVIHLEIGDLDFDSPPEAVDVAIGEIISGNTHYVPSRGHDGLLRAAAFVTERSRGFRPTKEQLLVTPGANIQTYLALAAICSIGDGVAFAAPYFPSYLSQCVALGLRPMIIETNESSGFRMTSLDVERAAGLGAKAIIINSPGNPSGTVYGKPELSDLYAAAQKDDLLIISDEVYARTVFDGREHESVGEIDKCEERVVIVNGFSKSHAMPGWRLGVATGPEKVIENMRVLQETMLSCVPPFIQAAGAAVLESQQGWQRKMSEELEKRRNALVNSLIHSAGSLKPFTPNGAIYCWCQIQNGMTSAEYCKKALSLGVVLSPGTMFGCEGYVRIAFVRPVKELVEAVDLLSQI